MGLATTPVEPPTTPKPAASATTRTDRLARGVILAGGILVLGMLAWGHLGLGALLVPPAATAAHQTVQAGPYQVTLRLDSGQLTARGPNTIALVVQDHSGHAIQGAAVRIAPSMTSMVMIAPTMTASAGPNGTYTARPIFGMAGPWQLSVSISAPGSAAQHAVFAAGVHWN